jgi:hypothetical protein
MGLRPAFSPGNELQRAAELLSKHWILAVPTAVGSVVLSLILIFGVLSIAATTVLGGVFGGHAGAAAGIGTGALFALGLFILGVVVLNLTQAVVIHAGEDAWLGRSPNLAASLGVVIARLPDLVVSMLATLAILLIPLALCAVLIGFPLLVIAGYFLLYVTPAVVLGRENGLAAVGTSFRIARTYVGESVVALLGVIAAEIVGSIANTLVVHIPLVNILTAFAIGGLTSAYAALVQARFYDLLYQTAPAPAG